MKVVGILLSLLVSAVIIYLALQNIQSGTKNQDPLNLAKPVEKARAVQLQVDLAAVQMAVQSYQVQNGTFPKSLSELVSSGILTESQTSKLDYNPGSGKVSLRPE